MMRLDFEKQNGLIPCIVQDVDTKKVLMLAYMLVGQRRNKWTLSACTGNSHRLRSRYNFIRGQTSWCGLSYGTLFLFL